MKLKFKTQEYQTQAVNNLVQCFIGQTNISGINYRIDPGIKSTGDLLEPISGFKNSNLQISNLQILENIKKIQQEQGLNISESLKESPGAKINLDIEMETGTGKTYCYIKTMFELNKCYGWSKFIIVVPSIAIREGVYKAFEITSEHFHENYHKKIRFFIYNSKQLHQIESFSSKGS